MFLATDISTGLDIRHTVKHQSLTDIQASAIEQALQHGWMVDRHVSFDECLALMISPVEPSGQDRVFYVDAELVGLSLSVMQSDTLEHRGCYGSIESLVAAISLAA
jgi:hypothetical protein